MVVWVGGSENEKCSKSDIYYLKGLKVNFWRLKQSQNFRKQYIEAKDNVESPIGLQELTKNYDKIFLPKIVILIIQAIEIWVVIWSKKSWLELQFDYCWFLQRFLDQQT